MRTGSKSGLTMYLDKTSFTFMSRTSQRKPDLGVYDPMRQVVFTNCEEEDILSLYMNRAKGISNSITSFFMHPNIRNIFFLLFTSLYIIFMAVLRFSQDKFFL